MEMSLFQKQSQGLVMTTQMKQAMHMLHCSAMELNEYVLSFAQENPFVEVDPVDLPLLLPLTAATLAHTQSTWRTDTPPYSEAVAAGPTLSERLQFQLNVSGANEALVAVTNELIGSLNESGYLTEDIPAIASRLGVAESMLKEALSLLQSFDPPGVGARCLRECLSLQLCFVPSRLRDLAEKLIHSHLDAVADGKVTQIAKTLDAPVNQVQEAIDAIRRLDPRPGLAESDSATQFVIPDAVVEFTNDVFIVKTNEKAEPHLHLNHSLLSLLRQPQEPVAHAYMVQQLQAAKWLVRCMEQRRTTLKRVMELIVEIQQPYFHFGPSKLHPLTMRQVGDRLGLHESTVSRAVNGKYIQTSFGVRPLRYFFSTALNEAATYQDAEPLEVARSAGGSHVVDGVSAEAVRHRIRLEVSREDSKCPLSDAELVRLLASDGIRVARRTVAKYREELGIVSSYRRRRFE